MSKQERMTLFITIKSNGLKMKDIAKACDISASMLSRFFNNKCNMSNENIEAVIDYVEKFKMKEVV